MKRAQLGLAAGLALATMVGSVAVAGPASAAKPTKTTVIRAVTASGHAAHGYRVVKDSRDPISCTTRSPFAVDNRIAWCGSSADYAVACWKQARKHRVLCLSDPYTKTLRSIRLAGKFTAVTAPKKPRPLALTLHSGKRYLASVGGGSTKLKQHPSWVAFYVQRSTFKHAVYGPKKSDGINQQNARWSAQVYSSASKPGVKRLVDHAYYVGTQR